MMTRASASKVLTASITRAHLCPQSHVYLLTHARLRNAFHFVNWTTCYLDLCRSKWSIVAALALSEKHHFSLRLGSFRPPSELSQDDDIAAVGLGLHDFVKWAYGCAECTALGERLSE
jgi:hypothetical protein